MELLSKILLEWNGYKLAIRLNIWIEVDLYIEDALTENKSLLKLFLKELAETIFPHKEALIK